MHRGSSQGGIMKKRADQMLALLAVCHVLCPGQRMDDQVKAWVNKLHSETISNMRGANPLPAFEDVFTKGAPSFISPHTDLTADIEQSTAVRVISTGTSLLPWWCPSTHCFFATRLHTNRR